MTEIQNKNVLVSPDTTLLEAINVIETSRFRIAVVVSDDLKLLGSLTDGDVRRAILKGAPMTASVDKVMNKSPRFFVTECGALSSHQSDVLRAKYLSIEILIAVDDLKHFLGLIDLREGNLSRKIRADLISDAAVFFLVGGQGKRLRPLTLSTPKPMLEFAGKPLLHLNIERLRNLGFQKFFLSVGYLKDQIIDYFGDGSAFEVEISYVHDTHPLGTAGSLGLIGKSNFKDLLVINGDLFTSFDYLEFLQFHRHGNYDCSIATRTYSIDIPFGVVKLEGDIVESMEEKPRYSFHCSGGIYLFRSLVLDNFPAGYLDMPELVNMIAKQSRVGVQPIYEDWIDIGTPTDYSLAQDMISGKK